METKQSGINIATARQIRAELKAHGKSVAWLAGKTGLTVSTLTRVTAKDASQIRDVTVTQLKLVAAAFGLTMDELVRRAEEREQQMLRMSEAAGTDELKQRRELNQTRNADDIDGYQGPKAADSDPRLPDPDGDGDDDFEPDAP